MAFIDNLVRINITQAAAPVAATPVNVPLLIADTDPGWSDDKAVHTYGSLEELTADGFDEDSATYVYAQKMLSGDSKPPLFLVGRKAGTALAASDLDAIIAADSRGYAIVPVNPTDADIMTAAEWVLPQERLVFAASKSADNYDAASKTSLAYQLKNGSFRRSPTIYTPTPESGVAAAWVGNCITATPGTINWAYQTLAGISADNLSTSQFSALLGDPVDQQPGNGMNVYVSQYSKGVSLLGTTPTTYIDLVHIEDYLRSKLKAAIFSRFVAGAKVPMTDKGVALFISDVDTVLKECAQDGSIDDQPGKDADGKPLPTIKVYADPVASIPAAQRAARRCPTIYFQATLAGAIDSVQVVGQLNI